MHCTTPAPRLRTALLLTLLLIAMPNRAPAAAGSPPAPSPNDATVTLNFDDVDIVAFIKYISELTGNSFIIDPQVKGKVTLFTPIRFRADDAMAILESVLEVNGLTAVSGDKAIKIVPRAEARGQNLQIKQSHRPGDQLITRLIQTRHNDPEELKRVLQPLLDKNSIMVSHRPSGILIVTDTAANIDRLQQIISQIDVPMSDTDLKLFTLEYALADEMSGLLNKIFAATPGPGKKQPARQRIKVVPDRRANLLVILAPRQEMERIGRLIGQLDRPLPVGRGNIHVTYLQYANAEELARVLTALPQQQKGGKGGKPGRAVLADKVDVVADKATNSLVITASSADFQVLEEVIDKLDIPRRMVYLEALIMEVNTSKDFQLGVEWSGMGDLASDHRHGGVIGGFTGAGNQLLGGLANSTLPQGFSMGVFTEAITIGSGDHQIVFPNIGALLNAYKSDNDVHILSTPQILTTDNQEAMIHVGENVPYLTKEASGDQNYQTYEYRDVGVTMRITPQINQQGLVRLQIAQEVVKLKGSSQEFRPSTLKRQAQTTVVIPNGNTVVIGGIIGDDDSNGEVRVPLLGDIPILGNLFRFKNWHNEQTNLFIFLTPHIIQDPASLADTDKPVLRVDRQRQWHRKDQATGELVALGAQYLKNNEPDVARAYLDSALKVDPANPYALYVLALTEEQTGNIATAEDLYRQLLVLPAEDRGRICRICDPPGQTLGEAAAARLAPISAPDDESRPR